MTTVISAYDLSNPSREFPFGLDAATVASALRRLADAIDSERALPQRATVASEASNDDFVLTTFTISYAEKQSPGR